ncbi:MAG: regulatory protein RecX [Desulfitobacteriaceae bacterium]
MKSKKNALSLALSLLSRKALTVYEIEKRLLAKECAKEEITEAVARLQEWGYLNDREYALGFCRSYSHRKSRRKIREDLRLRGVNPELIAKVLSECYSEEEEFEFCLLFAGKIKEELLKQNRRTRISEHEAQTPDWEVKHLMYAKIGRRLEGKGYPPVMIHKALQHLRAENEEENS